MMPPQNRPGPTVATVEPAGSNWRPSIVALAGTERQRVVEHLERSIVGALLVDDAAPLDCVERSDFAMPRHRLIYDAIGEARDLTGTGAVQQTVGTLLRNGRLADAGGHDYIVDLATETLHSALLSADAVELRQHARQRKIADLGRRIAWTAQEGGDVAALLAEAAQVAISAGSPQPAVRFLRPCDMAAMPPRELIWRAGFGRGELGVLFGRWGSCKSFVALGLAVALADGTLFLGFKTRPCVVGLIVGEGAGGQVDRLRAATAVARVADPADPMHDRLGICCGIPALTTAEGFNATVRAVEAMPLRPDVVVIDTVARAMSAAGLDEDRTAEMGLFVAACDRLKARFPGMAVLLVHHSGNGPQERGRGSSVLPAACDFQLRVEPLASAGSLPRVRLVFVKVKDGALPPPMRLDFAQVVVRTDDEGEPVTSLRLSDFCQDASTEQPNTKPNAGDLLDEALEAAGDEGLTFNAAKTATTKAASTVSEHLKRRVQAGKVEPFTDAEGKQRWRCK